MAQNFALERDELERGYVLACQSYPAAGEVTLDFDQ
jgi:ring-1,2-phenylacetyl-CoA epoxidase subunit PaaE